MIAELFSRAGLVALVPLVAACALAFVRSAPVGAWLNIAASTLAFGLACLLPWEIGAGSLLLVDALSAHMAILTAVVGMTTA